MKLWIQKQDGSALYCVDNVAIKEKPKRGKPVTVVYEIFTVRKDGGEVVLGEYIKSKQVSELMAEIAGRLEAAEAGQTSLVCFMPDKEFLSVEEMQQLSDKEKEGGVA